MYSFKVLYVPYFLAFPFPEQAISEEIREREWANVVTAHLHNSKVRTWNTVKGALDSVVLNAKVEPVSPAVSREGVFLDSERSIFV